MPTERTSSPRMSTDAADHDEGMADSLKDAMHSLREVRAYFWQYVAARADAAKATARLMVLYAFLSVFGIIVALTATVTATVLLVVGAAGGLAAALGGRVWLANLLVGILFIAGVSVGMSVAYPMITGRLRRATVRKYEAMRRKQQAEFGHHAEDKARGHV